MQRFIGIVQRGTKRAASLGFPTVNIPLDDAGVSGVYAARVLIGETSYIAVAFADPKRKVLEAHILNTDQDLYGREITVELLGKIRDSRMFVNDTDLRSAIENDIEKAYAYFKMV